MELKSGIADFFKTDATVEVKQPNYYALVKEAAKAELMTNAINAEVPECFIQAMITGEKPEFLTDTDAEKVKIGVQEEYEQITGAAVSMFEAQEKHNGIIGVAEALHRLIDTLYQNRLRELMITEENKKESEKEATVGQPQEVIYTENDSTESEDAG